MVETITIVSEEMFPKVTLFILAAALLGTSVGFKHYHWFLSIGNAFAVGAIGVVLLVYSIFSSHGSLIDAWLCILLIIYGIRMAMYLIGRHKKNEFKPTNEANKKRRFESLDITFFFWVYISILYVAQCMPIVYNIEMPHSDDYNLIKIIGCIIATVSLKLEDIADDQKTKVKKIDENKFCDVGLHKMCRFPQYLFEILFWTGICITSFGAVRGNQWITIIVGYVMILFVDINHIIRLEDIHIQKYGNNPDYCKYADTTPILIPLIPIYHLSRQKMRSREEVNTIKNNPNL